MDKIKLSSETINNVERILGMSLMMFLVILIGCDNNKEVNRNKSIEEIAGNEEIRKYMEGFKGRGMQADSTSAMPPEETLKHFQLSEGLELDLVLSEPLIYQPVDISFDHRGRMWVVQYNQYPYPEGVKVVDIDNHNRVVFDTVPQPPSEGIKGADKISVFEDTNGDGKYDKSEDVITGLNIATSVLLGREKVWVLTPPYLVAYPDTDGDGVPEGKPEVHLEGFGLEDTHAVANNLRWGPDGWIYGAQGSTTTANISSKESKNVYFSGQAIWRYHPETFVFEIFAEGGGNTFDVEFDNKGRVYSGDNGTSRGFNYKQGGYYKKIWGKHGALTNQYAFGFLPGMELKGEKIRFTHAWVKYEEDNLPERYQGKILALNPLHNFVRLTKVEKTGSTFKCIDEEKILQSDDNWFRPVDIKVGPDGGVYLADWSDSRLSHVNPRDNWDKKTGRIYRLRGEMNFQKPFDLSTYSNKELVELLSHKSKWFRQQAIRQIGDRKDGNMLPALKELIKSATGQTALEALWAINLSGGLDDELALETMKHTDPYVRMWTVRLLGDVKNVSAVIAQNLAKLAETEEDPEVIGQIASSTKRLPVNYSIPIVKGLINNSNNINDQHNLMFTWWALESIAEGGRDDVLDIFEEAAVWDKPIVFEGLLERLMRRYAVAGGKQNYAACVRLLEMAPSESYQRILLNGVKEGLRGVDYAELPDDLVDLIEQNQSRFGQGKWAISLKQNKEDALEEVLKIIPNTEKALIERLEYISILGEIDQPKAIPTLLKVVSEHHYSVAIRLACLKSLRHYDDLTIGEGVASAYPHQLRDDETLKYASLSLLASRPVWAREVLNRITTFRQIKKDDFPLEIIKQLKMLDDADVTSQVEKIWPDVRIASSIEKSKQILRIKQVLKSGKGNSENGQSIYETYCGTCHKLFDEGGNIGPDLTGYERSNINYMALNIVDPNADIREGYVNYRIKKKDGQLIVGTVVDNSAGKVIVKPMGRGEIILAADDIEEMTAQKTSLMPEYITEQMTDQQIQDLFAFLMK